MTAQANDLAQSFIKFLETHGATQELGDILTHLQTYYDQKIRKADTAIIKTATPLTETEETEIKIELKQIFNKELKIETIVDPEIVGGIRIQVGDIVIDRTLRSKLKEIKDVLLR